MIARRTTRKIITRAIVLVIAGAIVNVAMAWMLAWKQSALISRHSTSHILTKSAVYANAAAYLVEYCRMPGRAYVEVERKPGPEALFKAARFLEAGLFGQPIHNDPLIVPRWSYAHHLPNNGGQAAGRSASADEPQVSKVVDEAFGWPLVAMSYRRSTFDGRESRVSFGINVTKTPLRRRVFPHALPLRPLPSGIVVNAGFYAVCLHAPIVGFASMRRFVRDRRHQCTGCGYPLSTSARCPECGHEYSHRTPREGI